MPRASVDASALIDWGVAASALPGQAQSGDSHLVKAVATGVLVAVVDGLGHGTEAATAARTAVNTLDEHGSENGVGGAPAPGAPAHQGAGAGGGGGAVS